MTKLNCLLPIFIFISSCASNSGLPNQSSSSPQKKRTPGTLVYKGQCLKYVFKDIDLTNNCGVKMSKTHKENGEQFFLATSKDESILIVFNSSNETIEWVYRISGYTTDLKVWNKVSGSCTEERILNRGTRKLTCNLRDSQGARIEYAFEGLVIKG